jgi:hypothetical protein
MRLVLFVVAVVVLGTFIVVDGGITAFSNRRARVRGRKT